MIGAEQIMLEFLCKGSLNIRIIECKGYAKKMAEKRHLNVINKLSLESLSNKILKTMTVENRNITRTQCIHGSVCEQQRRNLVIEALTCSNIREAVLQHFEAY